MRLAVFSHKPCWRTVHSPTGIATDGGFPFQMQALSELFDETRLLVPVANHGAPKGEVYLAGRSFTVVPLTKRSGTGFLSKLSFIPWLLRNATTIIRELRSADAIHAPIPGDVGTVGMLLAWLSGKPLFVRHCGNWLSPVTTAERFWRWFMERTAGGRNVMMATGGTDKPPSQTNPNVHWIFASSLSQSEMEAHAHQRTYPASGDFRLVIVARQERAKGAGLVIRALPILARRFSKITLDIIGEGSALAEFKRLAAEVGVTERVRFAGKLNHLQVLECLKNATLFTFPTTSSDGFPKAVLEALASGLPVVATRVSVLPQLLSNGAGVLIDNATPEEVAAGVTQVLDSASVYESMSRQAIETARSYSLDAWRNKIGDVLSSAWGPLKTEFKTRLTEPASCGAAVPAPE